jgi:hypothetical protein
MGWRCHTIKRATAAVAAINIKVMASSSGPVRETSAAPRNGILGFHLRQLIWSSRHVMI